MNMFARAKKVKDAGVARRKIIKKFKRAEEGSAIILIVTLSASMMTIGTLSLYSAVDMHKMVSNVRTTHEALNLAEAGLSQGASLLKSDDTDGFNDSELTSTYPTEPVTIGSSTYNPHVWIDTTTVEPRKKYKVWISDNDDAAWVSGPSNDTIVDNDTDSDGGVILISKGWVEDNSGNILSSAFVKGLYKMVASEPKYAILTEGNLALTGNVSVAGSTPSMHTNGDLTSTGNSDEAEGPVTASGTMTGSVNLIGGGSTGTGSATPADTPHFSADYYKSQAASLVLDTSVTIIADGTCQRVPASGGTECVEVCNNSGTYKVESPSSSGGAVCQTPDTNKGGVFYFDGPLEVDTSGDWNAVVLAAGRITLKTGTELKGSPDLPGVALVSDADVVYAGGVEIGSATNQLGMYAGIAFDFQGGGNKTLWGPLIGSGAASLTSLTGNILIYYDNTSPPVNGPPIGKLISWSQVE